MYIQLVLTIRLVPKPIFVDDGFFVTVAVKGASTFRSNYQNGLTWDFENYAKNSSPNRKSFDFG